MALIVSLKHKNIYRNKVTKVCTDMPMPRLKQYAVWWRERDAEIFNIVSTMIVLRRSADKTSNGDSQ